MSDVVLRPLRRPRLWLGLWSTMLFLTVVLCLLPLPPRIPTPIEHFDKFEHLLGYLVLAAYAAMLFASRRALLLAGLGLFLLGASIELLQGLLPWRRADPMDLVANALGVLLGLLFALTPLSRLVQRIDRALR